MFFCVVLVINVFIGLLLSICRMFVKVLYRKWFKWEVFLFCDNYFFVFLVGLLFWISFFIVLGWKNFFLMNNDRLLVIIDLLLVMILVCGMGYFVGIGLNNVVIVN